jgi:uncharacterized membrane protein YoaT (DUF817 family)
MNNAVSCLFDEMIFILKTHTSHIDTTLLLVFDIVVITIPMQILASHFL